jgi:hypothetical protein
MNTDHTAELTDEDIQRELAGDGLRGPRSFRGRHLAELSLGLRDVFYKVVQPDDTSSFFDLILMEVLARAYAETPEERRTLRRKLILDTDDMAGFRADVSLIFDDLTEAEQTEARRISDEIFGLIEKAKVKVASAEKKSSAPKVKAKPTPTRATRSSGTSAAKRAGSRKSSAGK